MLILEHIKARISALRRRDFYAYTGLVVVIILFIPTYIIFLPPNNFPTDTLISIPADATSEMIADQLAEVHVVRSSLQFHAWTRITGQDRSLQSGIYVFSHPLGLWGVATRLANGEHGIEETRVTFTEGMTVKDMAQTLKSVPGFDTKAFLRAASTSEGYLFPDTYFILPGTSPDDLVQRLRSEFDTRITKIKPEINTFGRPLADDVIMASILEREAKGEEDKRMVAGILYNRIRLGMALQVDAVFGYAHGENGYTPTAADLTSNSPYNTYRIKGLPPTPIANPGLESLLASVTPTKTLYLYYLTGKDGKMHYAKTFEEHKANRTKYLD